MTEKQWRDCLGELVRDYIRSPELEYYFSIKMNKPRAGVMVKQQSLFVRHRRDCWAHGSWMTSEMPWTESLAGMTITEWCNDDRLLGDLGGGQSTRMAKKWMEEMGFTWKQIPNLQAHSQADEKHSDMFLPFLAEYGTGKEEALAIRAAGDSLAFNAMYRKGIARAQERIPL
jgi:hypothetical protein